MIFTREWRVAAKVGADKMIERISGRWTPANDTVTIEDLVN